MRIAIVHDYLNQAGGAERVVASIHRLFPDAPIYTTIADPAVVRDLLPGADVRTSWMQRIPGVSRHYRKMFMLYPSAIESLDLAEFDLVISSSSAYAKSVRTRPDACHVCYCHTPMRFGWTFESYADRESWGPITRTILPPLISRLREWDRRTAVRPSVFIANSREVAGRIARHYGRPARVVHPPVAVERFTPSAERNDSWLVVSRLIPYKRVDLAVDAFTRLGRPLIVIGDGPARVDLERRAGPTIRFLGRRSDPEVAASLATCRGLVFPGEEDFGIVPLEANAAGRPVVAYRGGGALETVVEGRTGLFFDVRTPDALVASVTLAESVSWDQAVIRDHAASYREALFHRALAAEIRTALQSTRRRAAERDGVSGLDLDHDGVVGNGDGDRSDPLELLER